MEKKRLQELFCTKITMEVKQYKRKMLKRSPEEIISKAYQISTMIEIYELLVEKSLCMTETALELMLPIPNTLALFYSNWMKYKDSARQELDDSVDRTMEFLNVSYKNAQMEEKEVRAA